MPITFGNPLDFIAGIIIIPLGTIAFLYGFHQLKKIQLMKNTPTSKIRSIALGLVELSGTVIPTKPLFTSPYSKQPCVYYSFKVEELQGSGDSSKWVALIEDEKRAPFDLQDDTGKITIDTEDMAEVTLEPKVFLECGFGKHEVIEFKQFLEQKKFPYKNILGVRRSYKLTESYIEPNSPVYVFGTAKEIPSPDGSEAGKVVIGMGKINSTFLIFDVKEQDAIWGLYKLGFMFLLVGAGLILGGLAMILGRLSLFS